MSGVHLGLPTIYS